MADETFPYIESDAPVSHPGSLLAEELEVRDMSQRELARRIGRPFQVVNEIVRGRKAITAETALQLEAEFGTRAYLWLGSAGQVRPRQVARQQDARRPHLAS